MSYRITMDGQAFCSSEFEHTALLDPVVSLEVNKAGNLKFTMLPDHPMYDQIALRQSMFDVYQNNELIFEGIAVTEEVDFFKRKTVTCEGELTFLNDTIQRQAKYTNMTAASLLAAYLSVHNSQAADDRKFSLGSVTVDGGNGILRYTNYQSTMKEIGEDLVDNYGGFLRVRHQNGNRYLDYLAEAPRTSSQVIRIGKNLIDLSSNLSSLDIVTVLIPLGAKVEGEADVEGLEKRLDIKSVNNGKDYLIGTAANWYGYVWGTQTWDGVTTASALKTKGQEYLDEVQWSNLVISASAFDLGLMDEDVEQFRLLDMIRVVSEPHGIDRLFLLSKLDINLDHPADTQITLGKDSRLSLSARSVKNTTEIESVPTRIMTTASDSARRILDGSTDGNIYFRFDDETGKLYEIDIMDTNDPNTAQRIWRWNIGGWGYSNDGGQTYLTAATMDGAILATMITTGILKSDDGTTFYLDLDNGVLKGNFSELKISGAAGATQAYADQAEADAISTAASDATSKANAAKTAAINAAASDATSKANAAQAAAEATAAANLSTYDSNLNQLAVFNKLTNNGQTQGIYLQNGKVYINGEYIKANSISALQIIAGAIGTNELAANAVTAEKISVSDLQALGATIAGWNISETSINKTITLSDGTQYRIKFQPPSSNTTPTSPSWILSCEKITQGTVSETFVLYSDGSARFGSTQISSSGQIRFANGASVIGADGDVNFRGTQIGADGILSLGGKFNVNSSYLSFGSYPNVTYVDGEKIRMTRNNTDITIKPVVVSTW